MSTVFRCYYRDFCNVIFSSERGTDVICFLRTLSIAGFFYNFLKILKPSS
jgi:hypothetical protein